MPVDQQLQDQESLMLHELKNGDVQAYLKVYDHYAKGMLAYAAARLATAEDAADLVHDVFLKVWVSRAQIQVLKPYLYTLLRNLIIDHIRRNTTRSGYAKMLQNLDEPEYNMEQELYARELQKIIDEAIDKLPLRAREIYQLSRLKHMTIEQIALRLHISEQTVKNQLSIANNILRKASKNGLLLLILQLLR